MRIHARALASLALAAALGCGAREPLDACTVGETPSLSLLAVGDTGDRPEFTHLLDQQETVARVLAEEQRRHPADALLFLGDNFYSEGLEEHEAEERIRVNLVRPFCAFVASDGPRFPEMAEACPVPAADRTPIPLYPVLGNHDYNSPESPKLQRELVPQFVSNWKMPLDQADLVELGAGVSLVVADSEDLSHGADPAPLVEALRAAQGPWRVLVAHQPISAKGQKWDRALASAIAGAGVPVQLLVAGHDHNLQISEPGPGQPALVVISGSGSRVRGPTYGVLGTKFLHVRPGFARIDLVGEGAGQRLVVSLIETPKHALEFWSPTRVVACWSVDREGRVSGEARIANPDAG